MATIGIEISDVGILAAGGDPVCPLDVDHRSIESPGYALQIRKRMVYGIEALEQARLHPRQVNNRFWAQLGTHRLAGTSASANNYAEMAFAHLEQIRDRLQTGQQEWVFAVPDFLDEDKLGLLLGIARELAVPVPGLVSLPVAAVQATAARCPLLHVDVHLHRVEIARIAQTDRVELERTHAISEDGWDNLLAHLAKGVADHFVKATRFDPLHDAASEQQLFTQLARLLHRGLGDSGTTIALKTDRSAYSLSVLPSMLLEASAAFRGKVVQAVRAHAGATRFAVQLSHRAFPVPGLREDLARLPGAEVAVLAPGSAASGVLLMLGELGHDASARGLTFTTRRNRRPNEPSPEPAEAPTAEAPPPTHVLYEDRAYPIGSVPLSIGPSEEPDDPQALRIGAPGPDAHHCVLRIKNNEVVLEPEAGHAVQLEGRAVTRPVPVRAGQRIGIGRLPRGLRLIVVLPTHGT